MRYPIYQINAFSKQSFGGNPACVVPLSTWLPDEEMLAIAKENGVAETAFYIEAGQKIQLRWFTPEIEIDLCGHATMAAAHCMVTHRAYTTRPVHFTTKSGVILVDIKDDKYQLDMPSRPGAEATLPKNIEDALSIKPKEVYKARDFLLVYESQADIEALQIDLDLFNQINLKPGGVIVTAPGDTHDFVSRYFTPQASILEDPVTGSAQCTLVPYWAKRLQKRSFHAYQCSQRGGELWCEDNGDRVLVSGYAFTYSAGWFAPYVEKCEKILARFWQLFLNTHALGKLPCPPSFYFCDNRQDADACATLVVKGIKQATAPSLWWFDKHKENRPEVGDYHIITKWDGTPIAVIQTTAVAVIPFGQVGAGFAHAEGEGDRSLAQWQEVHRAYYAREMGCEARDITDDFAVVCHHFQTVFCA